MDEGELRRKVEREVGSRIPDAVWDLLGNEGYFHIEGEEDVIALAASARRFLRQLGPGAAKRAKKGAQAQRDRPITARLHKREARREEVRSDYFARLAAHDPALRRFRSRVLAIRLLTNDEAVRFLESPAARLFSVDQFRDAGIDPARHAASLQDEHLEPGASYSATIQIKGGPVWEFQTQRDDAGFWNAERTDGARTFSVRPVADRLVQGVYRAGSAIDELVLASSEFALRGYPWPRETYAGFILTGVAPRVLALTGSLTLDINTTNRRSTAKIEVEPWVSASDVLWMYRRLQTQLLGRHNRPMSDRRLELFAFVNDRLQEDGNIPPWRGLMEEWNEAFKRWRYEDVRNFSRDYWAAARGLLFPSTRFTG